MHGHLDACTRLEVSGWAYAPELPVGERLVVVALVDGVGVARGIANRLRADLAPAGIGDGRHAFLLNLPPELHDGRSHLLQVFAHSPGGSVELTGSPQTFVSTEAEAVRGALHILDAGLIAGWALSRREPGRRLELQVTVNGVALAPVRAHDYRPDLRRPEIGDGYHGFQMAVPASVMNTPSIEASAVDLVSGSVIPPGTVRADRATTYWGRMAAWDASAEAERAALRERLKAAPAPLLSVLMPVYDPPLDTLAAAIESVRAQSHVHWQLCIADDASRNPGVRALLSRLAAEDPRIEVVWRQDNGHISACSNTALTLVRGDYTVLLDHDDLLHPDALLNLAATIAEHPGVGLIFSDEDKCDEQGHRYSPYFKPGWNPDLMLGQNMVSHLGAYRSDLVRQVGGFRLGLEGSQDYDLALRVRRLLEPRQIQHVPRVLYHWRAVAGSTARAPSEKNYAAKAMRRALRDDLHARGERGAVAPRYGGVITRFRPALPRPAPRVAVVLGTWTHWRQRRHAAVQAVMARAWPGLGCHALAPGESLHAAAASLPADTEVVVWLAPQVRPHKGRPAWLREMVAQVLREGVGVVGAKVLDEQDRIVSFGDDGFTPQLLGLSLNAPGPLGVALLCRTVPALSGHALAIRRCVLDAWVAEANTSGADPHAPCPPDAWAQALCAQAHLLRLRCLVTPDAPMTLLTPCRA